jgi:hypothetical protein
MSAKQRVMKAMRDLELRRQMIERLFSVDWNARSQQTLKSVIEILGEADGLKNQSPVRRSH